MQRTSPHLDAKHSWWKKYEDTVLTVRTFNWNDCKLTKPDPKLEGLADVKDPTLGTGGFLFVHNEIYQVEKDCTK